MSAWVVEVLSVVVAATEGDTPWILLLAGPAGAVGVYWGLYRYYRNTDKSHAFEKETTIEAQPVVASDERFDKVRGTSRSEVDGNNVSRHRTRVDRLH